MMRSWLLSGAVLLSAAHGALACDAVAPSVLVTHGGYVPVAVSVAPAAVVTPLAIEVDALHVLAAPARVRVLSARCAVARARALIRPVRPRVIVRVR